MILRWLYITLFASVPSYALDLAKLRSDASVLRSDGSDLNITIMGTIANKAEPQKNVALIKENGKIRAVRANMPVLGVYRVATVQEKYILLLHGDSKHIVFQNKFANEFNLEKRSKTSDSGLIFAEDGFERSDNRVKMTAAYRDNLVENNLSNVLMQATAIPHHANGQVVGFKILQIDPGSIYDKSGFIDHDVITEINGSKLNSASGAIKLLNSLKGAEDINVKFLRFGEEKSLKISVR